MSQLNYDFSGRTALITGGATGIGRETAKAFAAAGAAVMIGDIDLRAEETVAIIRQAGGTVDFKPTDVTDGAQVRALVEATVSTFGGLHMAFNNAGVLPPLRPIHEVPEDELDLAINVDFKGVWFAMQAEIRHFLQAGGGSIVNTASVGALIADPNMAAYCAMKHAVAGLTKAAAVEYATRNIRVNCIAPGFIATPMTEVLNDKQKEMILGRVPAGKLGTPEDIAAAVLYLASDEAGYVTGQTLHVNGGMAMI